MNPRSLSLELTAIGVRTRKLMSVSALLHAMFFSWLFFSQKLAPPELGVTEITWLEPVDIQPIVSKVAPMVQPKPLVRERPAVTPEREHFVRLTREADIALEPQSPEALEDKIGDRLEKLQRQAALTPAPVKALTPTPLDRPALADATPERVQTRGELTREDRPAPRPVTLKRTEVRTQRADVALPTLPDVPNPKKAKAGETIAERTVAGATLAGPIADRPLIDYRIPTYPEWAKREAVEGSVTIYFVVLANGRVKENVMVQKTSGFTEFDDNATKALLAWRFAPVTGGAGEQWGTITFHYRLSDS